MYTRIIRPPAGKSFFLFGPRAAGKTTWLRAYFPNAIYIDLLEAAVFNDLLARPERLENFIPPNFQGFVIVDEVQRVPEILNEVHRLIEQKKITFILTGSSARKLKHPGVNLLGGRALTYHLYPLTVFELGDDFDLEQSLQFGHLPAIFNEQNKKKFLESYIMTYLEQEIRQEGLTRNIAAFSRFLEAASFSQGSVLNITEVARECAVHRKVAENYFSILEDMMVAYQLPVFSKKAKRRLTRHTKFYFFDTGVYRTLRPKGPLDSPEQIEGMALETLVMQELMAMCHYTEEYKLFYWRTAQGVEVDFILYGAKGIIAIEVKRTGKVSPRDLKGIKTFVKDYPSAKAFLLYGGTKKMWEENIAIVPVNEFLRDIQKFIA